MVKYKMPGRKFTPRPAKKPASRRRKLMVDGKDYEFVIGRKYLKVQGYGMSLSLPIHELCGLTENEYCQIVLNNSQFEHEPELMDSRVFISPRKIADRILLETRKGS